MRKEISETCLHRYIHRFAQNATLLGMTIIYFLVFYVWTVKDVARLHGFGVSIEPSLFTHVTRTSMSFADFIILICGHGKTISSEFYELLCNFAS